MYKIAGTASIGTLETRWTAQRATFFRDRAHEKWNSDMARQAGPRRPKSGSEKTADNGQQPEDNATPPKSGDPNFVRRPPLGLGMERATIPLGLNKGPAEAAKKGEYMIELNLMHGRGVDGAGKAFKKLFKKVISDSGAKADPVSKSYFSCFISLDDLRRLVAADEDEAGGDRTKLCIYKVWPDFTVRATIDKSISTVKADAAARSFAAYGSDIVWAVVDSGINADHAHFAAHQTLSHPSVVKLHQNFTTGKGPATIDDFGHGTHVAGIIAGKLQFGKPARKTNGVPAKAADAAAKADDTPAKSADAAAKDDAPKADEIAYAAGVAEFKVYQQTYEIDEDGNASTTVTPRDMNDGDVMSGIAPLCRLVSLKVLDENGEGKTSNVIRALTYIREKVNGDPKMLKIHGVNLSLGYEFDAEMFACGQSPICVEVDRLVNSGVVVVTVAGNTGYGKIDAAERPTGVGLSNTINDPGNAALAITVGSTHRDAPHTYGVSYFSSKGPTGDGRLKPDLVAPGERITSCAAGKSLKKNNGPVAESQTGYIDKSGTSMAAPHVSGAIAAFLSIRREFIQKPIRVKELFMQTATCLGRERYFQGSGVVDLMRAIQSV
jgi:subtilisin family serine protease